MGKRKTACNSRVLQPIDKKHTALNRPTEGRGEYGACQSHAYIGTLGHEYMSDTRTFTFLTDITYKSLHDIVLLFMFLLQREAEQFRVSLLIVHLIKVVRQVSGMSLLCFSFVV